MAKNSLFRGSVGGYNKDDVNAYISKLGVQFSDRENELEGEIKQLKLELEVLPALKAQKERAEILEGELERATKENADLTEAIGAQGAELEALKEKLSRLTAEKELCDAKINELNSRLERYEGENASLRAEVELKKGQIQAADELKISERAEFEREKAAFEERAEEMLRQIQAQAKAVIDKANETAELIVSNAKVKAEGINSVSGNSMSYSNVVSTKKKDNLSGILDGHKSKMDQFFAAITKTIRGDGK